MAGIDLSPVLRGLAALSDLRLGLANSVGIFPSVLLLTWAETHTGNPWLTVGAALMALVAVSLLIGVISFYRDDDLVLSGVLLAAITGIGTGGSMIVSVAIVTGSLGAEVFLAAAGFFDLVMRLILLTPIMAAAVWVARRFRRYLAPDTLGNAQ